MYKKVLTLLTSLFVSTMLLAYTDAEITRLEADMLKYFDSNDIDTFFKITNKLKEASKDTGRERLFYLAWGNQAQFEATQQDYMKAFSIVDQIQNYAKAENSVYGLYLALHTKAMVLLQKQDYALAEQAFLEALKFRHAHFPKESGGDDLQELMKIANHRKDGPAAMKYARQLVDEPNVAPIHKGRGLYQLSQGAFKKNDTTEFNRIYDQMMELKKSDGIAALKPIVEVNHFIINGEYEEALKIVDQLDPDIAAERKAVIYHRMGDDANAYKYMQVYKSVSDSIVRVSHGNVVASCYVQMNNERLQKEQQVLEIKNGRLRLRWYVTVAASMIIILVLLLYRHRKTIKLLQINNKRLTFENKDAAKALEDLAELSFYDVKEELPLIDMVNVNRLGNSLTAHAQSRCSKGVTMAYSTVLPDDFEIYTNHDALKKLLELLIDNAVRINHEGMIVLSCEEINDKIRFGIADTTPDPNNKYKSRFIGMFSEKNNKLHYVGMTFKISESICRLLKGNSWFDRTYTKGTRLYVEIPKDPEVLLLDEESNG